MGTPIIRQTAPVKIHITGRTAYPGDIPSSYIEVVTPAPEQSVFTRALNAIGAFFATLLPDGGGKSTVTDKSLIIKTSPTIWEYEQFRMEWDRRAVLRDLDMLLKEDPRVKRANRVFAATSVRKGISVTVTSDVSEAIAKEAQGIIDSLMKRCQINAKLGSWARIIIKEGDLFLNPVIDVETMDIKNIKRLPSVSMQRNDDMMGGFQDLDSAFLQIDPISLGVISEFPLWQINHIRFDHEEGERYGNSQYLQIRSYWKKIKMTEEDLVVRRKTRAIPRRLHIIGSKDNPGGWTEIDVYKKTNSLNAMTSQITTDYYGNGLTDIKNLDGDAQLDHIKDIEHLQEVYMIGTGVPLHVLGFGKNVNRDVVEDQRQQFREDTQELRDLLEYGDSSPYSGLRFIFDFALTLKGIEPSLVEYNISWYANDAQDTDERIDRAIKLRSAMPKPLVSHRTAVGMVARDVGLENHEALEEELAQMEAEHEADMAEQQAIFESQSDFGNDDEDDGEKPPRPLKDSASGVKKNGRSAFAFAR